MKVINSIQIFCSLLFISVCSYGQIFDGGNGDGFSKRNKDATTLDNTSLAIIYEGSNGDGFDIRTLSNTTLTNTNLLVLYEGSNGDGFSNRILAATTLENTNLMALYEGSNGDGFSNRLLSATTLDNTQLAVLYDGSNGDGFSNRILSATTLENIDLAVLYDGSNGDGFDIRLLSATTLSNIDLAVLYDGSNGDGFNVRQISSFLDPNAVVDLRLRVIAVLQGPIINPENTGLMNDILRDVDMLPTTSPYADAATVNPSVFNTGGSSGIGLAQDDIVDWIWLEIRNKNNNTAIVDATSALIQRDGDIVDLDGTSDVILRGVTDSYFVTAKHRNHLGIMSNNTISLSVSPTIVNFNNGSTQTFGTNAQIELSNNNYAMWAGNTNGDGIVQYSGTTPDTPNILSFVLNDPANFLNFPTFQSMEYDVTDLNMDGIIQYSGTDPDTPFILQNVLGHPGNFLNFSTYQILEQLPEN